MAITSNIKRIDINFTPLRTSGSIEVVGSVPRRQIWSADTGEFTPDYTLTPLVLFPRITATDPDRYTPSGVVNARLTNMKWYEVQGTIRRLIEPGNARYEVVQDGDAKGRIRVKCNSSVITPLGLEFYAEYIDTRTGQVYVFRLSTVIPVSDATIPAPVLTLDSPATVVWNPLRQPSRRILTARLLAGDLDITASTHARYFWFRRLDTGEEEAITDGNGDNDWEVETVSGNTLTVDMDYMGNSMTYVCRATYNPDGTPPDAPIPDSPTVTTTLRRRLPKLEADWQGAPTGVPGDLRTLKPKVIVRDAQGVLPDAIVEERLKVTWLVRARAATVYTLVGEGLSPSIAYMEGMSLRMDVDDRGPMAVIVDDDGSYLTDEDGSFLFQRENE